MRISIAELKKAIELLEAEGVSDILVYVGSRYGEEALNLCAMKDEQSPLQIYLTGTLSKTPSSKSTTTTL
jgi:methylmalonyl-CoA mutase cobalamin-binding subunit